MDRDRDRGRRFGDRGRDQDYERTSPSESYRTAHLTQRSSRPDTLSRPDAGRSPPRTQRRSRSPRFRHRDRSPPERSWRDDDRGPPRRWSPRGRGHGRESRHSPPQGRFRSRSPPGRVEERAWRDVRARSPVGRKRGRDASPMENRGIRSPPPQKRERIQSPSRSVHNRPRSPPRRPASPRRDDARSPPMGPGMHRRQRSPSPRPRDSRLPHSDRDVRRPRSPSPATRVIRGEPHSELSSGRESATTSRRSSPPIHPSRLALQEKLGPPPGRGGPNRSVPPTGPRSPPGPSNYRGRSPNQDDRSPRRDRDWATAHRPHPAARPDSPLRGPAEHRSPPRRREVSPPRREDDRYGSRGPPQNPAISHRGDAYQSSPRDNPTGEPSRTYDRRQDFGPSRRSPPRGPAAPQSMSAHTRPANASHLAAPTQPRGNSSGSSGFPPRRDSSYAGPLNGGSRRGGYAPTPVHTRGDPRSPPDASLGAGGSPPSGGVPTGPRTSMSGNKPPFRPPHNSHNSTSRTYPLTQRFSHLSDLPSPVPGGRALPSAIDRNVTERLAKLQTDQKRLEAELAEKLAKKRAGLRTWDRLERESARDGLKSELAEQQVKVMAGEGGLEGSAF
ncbi:MAG: hypothetical protein M1825_006269 [Sarcosagium campestre]|nr:MAG: hypothetical protein M1825_006269 [Sarcosagium campestre]